MQVNPATAYITDYGDTSNGSSRVPKQTLDQDDFLRLLITQMTSQDPMNPKADLDSIAQMASFSALEQSRAMQADMEQLRTQQEILQASGMLGRTVDLQIDSQTIGSGVVDAVQIVDGSPKVVVGGKAYDLSQILTITPTPINQQP